MHLIFYRYLKNGIILKGSGSLRPKKNSGCKKIRKSIFPKSLSGIIVWYFYSKESEYYKKAKIIKHSSHPQNGKMVNGYYICPDCAEKLNFKCDLCNTELSKIEHGRY
jgi:hypothetical protein